MFSNKSESKFWKSVAITWMTLAVLLVFALSGCATVERALQIGQKSLAMVDVATDAMAKEYVDLVVKGRAHCAKQPDPAECEAAAQVSPAQVDKVCRMPEEGPAPGDFPCIGGAMFEMSQAYGKTAEGLSGMENAQRVLSSQLEAVRASSEQVSNGLSP